MIMVRTLTLMGALLIVALLGGAGCSAPPGDIPNVYQPSFPTAEEAERCSEIQYIWNVGDEVRSGFYPTVEAFCTRIEINSSADLMARWVTRDSDGKIINFGKWVRAEVTMDVQEFLDFCSVVIER